MAVLLSGTTIGGNAAIHAGNISTYALTSVPSNVITTSGGQTIAGTTYFSGGESLNLYGIRGRFTNEYIHLYNKVGIGHPSGWGQGEGNTPAQGLSTYGGMNIAYGTGASSTINGYLRINKDWAGGDYSAEQFTIRGTYPSIALRSTNHDSKWLIHHASELQFYYGASADNNTWTNAFSIPTNGDIYMSWAGANISTLLNAKQNASTAITTSNIGSQSVSYASSAGTAGQVSGVSVSATEMNRLKTTLGSTGLPYSCDIYVEGDPNTYYPVHFIWGDQDVWRRIIIKRGYSEEAPWDPVGSGVHHGGLLLDWEGNFGGWGGAEYSDRLRVFNESYTNVCADMYIYTHAMGYVFMLRGGHALYHIFSDQEIRGYHQVGTPDIAYSTSTLFYDHSIEAYKVYAPAPVTSVNSSRIDGLRTKKQSLFDNRYQQISTAINTGNIGSQSVNYANTAGRAYPRRSDGADINFYWDGQGGQPTWLWGSNDGQNFYVWNPSNFSVNYASSAGNSATTSQRSFDYIYGTSYLESAGAVYGTIFYDNNDRAFYLDPNSGSRLNAITYDNLYWAGDTTYGFIGRNVYADTVNGRGGDPLELNYYDGGPVKIGSGTYGSKDLYASMVYVSSGNAVIHAGNIASQSVSYADESGFASSAGSVEWTSVQNKPATFPPSSHTHDYLSNNSDSEQEVGLRYASWNAGAARMNTDPRWNESGYDADLGCLHIWAWTAGGSPYGRAGIALYNGSAYQYLTTRSGATGMFVNNQEIIHSGNIGSQSVNYATSAGNADTVDGYHESAFWRNDQNRVIGVLRFTGEGGDSGNGNIATSYGIYQQGGAWTHPYPDLCIGFHTGIKIGAYYGYGGTRFYNNSDWVTEIFSVGNGDNHVRVENNLYVGNTIYNNGNAVIHAGNIGSQSVSYASSAGNADTVDSLHASSFVRNDTTGQYLRAYYQYGSYLTTERPIDLRNQMGGSGMRVDFMLGAGGGSWNHVITFSGYDAYNMYQLGGYYDGGSTTNLYVRSEANHGTTSWTAWRRLLNEVADPYAVNMNQYVRTTDAPTFAEVYNNGWFRTVGHQGLYNPTNNAHFYPNNASYGSWRIDGSRNGWHGIHFDSGATLMMNGSETGVHREGVGWQWRWDAGTLHCHKGASGGGTDAIVLDSSNYNSYAPTLTGGNASGTWGINVTGSAGSASSSSRSSALDIVGYGSGNMTYYQTSGTFAGYSGWAGYFVSNHGDGATYYNQTIIMPFWGPPQYSRLQGGTFAGPYTFWSTENLNDYAPNMNQYVRTTDNVTFNTTTSPTILVNNHSDNTKGYRIHNTSGSSVSAMFVNSSNQLVIAAGAVDQINLNKKVYVNGVALGVNVAPSGTAGRIDASNDIVAYSSSDERLKHNITPIENALDKVKSLTGVEFDWKPEYKHAHGYEGHDTGIIAQQVEAVMPSAVRTNDTGFLAVRYEKLIGLLIEGMKEQQAQIDELKAKLDGLTK